MMKSGRSVNDTEGGRVTSRQEHEVRGFAAQFRISLEEARTAIEREGPRRCDIEAALGNRWL